MSSVKDCFTGFLKGNGDIALREPEDLSREGTQGIDRLGPPPDSTSHHTTHPTSYRQSVQTHQDVLSSRSHILYAQPSWVE